MKDARTRDGERKKEDAKARSNLNTIRADLIGTTVGAWAALGCPKVRGANKRDERPARRREKERDRNKDRRQNGSNRSSSAVGGKKGESGKRKRTADSRNTKEGERRTGRDRRKINGDRRWAEGESEEDRGQTRMQMDAVTHDATARGSHTKSRRCR